MRRIAKQFLLCGLVSMLYVGVTPASAAGPRAGASAGEDEFFGVTLRYAGEFAGFRIAAATAAADNVQISTSLNDLQIASNTGIRDPLPQFCIRSDANLVRCPLAGLSSVEATLGPGNDVWGVGITKNVDAAAIDLVTAYLGLGDDQASGGIIPNAIYGGAGRDRIFGGAARDVLFGGGRNDFLFGEAGNDRINCGKGNKDRFSDGPGRDLVRVDTCEIRLGVNF